MTFQTLLVVLTTLFFYLQFSNAQSLTEVQDSCGANVSCSDCFNLLVYETIRTSENQYNLQTAFYPPNTATPIYVVVKYGYRDDDENIMDSSSTWFWSTSTYYLYQPPAVLQFTSLFFADPSFRTSRLSLILPLNCMNASIPFMQLLTQRLQLLASSRNTYPSIDAEYEPKAESFETIDSFIRKNGHILPYLVLTQWVYFIAALALVIAAFVYLFCYENTKSSKTSFIKRILKTKDSKILKSSGDLEEGKGAGTGSEEANKEKSEDEKLYEEWQVKSTLIMHFVLSMVLSLFIILMSIIAQSHGNKLAKNEHSEVQEIFNFMKDRLKPLFVLTGMIVAQDLFLFILSGLLILGLFCYKGDDKWWILCIFSPVCPIAHILVHFTHIVIGFIHNEHHATSVGLFYVGAVILQVLMFKVVSHMYFTCFFLNKDPLSECCICCIINGCDINHYIIFGMVYFALSVVLFLLVAFVAGLYILLPINNAFDEAPDRLNTVISGIALLIGGYIIYLLKNLRKDNANANKKEN